MTEPEKDRVCQWSWIVKTEDDKEQNKVTFCKSIAEYRVTIHDREILNESGEWEKKPFEQYYCKKHFDEVYRNPPSSTLPLKWTFRRI